MLENFHFLEPLWLLALLPLPALAWWALRGGSGDSPWHRTVDARLLALLMVGRGAGSNRGPLRLLAAGWVIAALALAGPTWQRKPQPVFQTSAARVVVLDLSRTMNATDLPPSRLARARFKVEDVLAQGAEGQTGLVVYAGAAFTVAPLTRDANTIRALLDVLSPDLMPVQGSRADLGLRQAGDLMRHAGVTSGQVLLIADGIDPGHARAAEDAAASLRRDGYSVSVLGVGTAAGAPIVDAQGRALRDAAGQVSLTRLDAAGLDAVARAGGGRYLPISDNGSALRSLLDSAATSKVEREDGAHGAAAQAWQDQGPWLVLLLLPLAALAFRRNWLLGLVLLAGLAAPPERAMASTWDDAWQRRDQQAAAAMQAGDYAKAAALATDAEQRGSAEYKRGNYALALEDFSRASGAQADYNRGNALARLGHYADAVKAYDQALQGDPGNADAKANKAAVEALMKQQQNKQDRKQDQKQDQKQGGQQQGGQPQASNGQGGKTDQQQEAAQKSSSANSSQSQPSAQGQSAAASAPGQQAAAQPRPDAAKPGQAGKDAQSESASAQNPASPATPKEGKDFAEAARKLAAQAAKPAADDQLPTQAAAPGEASAKASEGQDQSGATGSADVAQPLPTEEQLAAEQWLRRIPDDPGGLLRRKFLYQYRQRAGAGVDDATGTH